MPDLSSRYWFLRIDDLSGFNIQELIVLTDWGVEYVVRESPESNPHYHIFLKYKTERTKSTINKYLTKQFPLLSGNGAFCNKEVPDTPEDIAAVLRYMSKGTHHGYTESNPCVIFRLRTINRLSVEQYHNDYWKRFKGLSGGKTKSTESTSDRYIRQVKELVITRTYQKPNITDLCNLMMEVSNGKLNDHIGFACLQSLMYHYNPTVTAASFTQRMCEKLGTWA